MACMAAIGAAPGRFAVVTVLSPRMVYSMTEWPRMRAAALAEGLVVVAWRSTATSEAEWQDAMHKAAWSADEAAAVGSVPAACLAWAAQPNHYPFSRLLGHGQVHPWPIWGVMPDAAWVQSLRFRRLALAKVGSGAAP